MSIFKDTLKQEIQNQLKARQEAILSRTPAAIQYFNARNSWIRMSSAVDVAPSKGAEPTNELAKKYILQGGVLLDKALRSGVGTSNEAYSTLSPGGTPNRLGLRPMPGVTGIDVKSLSAYGSLREVEVKFNAWDIKQLEDLELLYMRPGYTVLIEWGWAPYLDNAGGLQSNISFYDIIEATPSKEQVFKDLYNTAAKTYSGNYEAMYGYVKNYSWSARPDGGYDCSTTIISIGEVMESLKVNYAPFDHIQQITEKGVIASRVEGVDVKELTELSSSYSKNILAGLFYEMFEIGQQKMGGSGTAVTEGKKFTIKDPIYQKKNGTWGTVDYYYDMFKETININGDGPAAASGTGKIGASDDQIYITLETLCNLLNNYVIFKDSSTNTAYVKCSVLDREYDKNGVITPNPLTGEGYLKCLAHPLEISIDPTVCAIKSPVWINGFKVNKDILEATQASTPSVVIYDKTLSDAEYNTLIQEIKTQIESIKSNRENREFSDSKTNQDKLIQKMSSVLKGDINKIKELSRRWFLTKPTTNLYSYLDIELNTNQITAAVGDSTSNSITKAFILKQDPVISDQQALDTEKKKLETTQTTASKNLAYLNNLPRPFFPNDEYVKEIGIIGNIFVNLNFLYRLALDNNLESQDKKEKNDINLYDFLKRILSEVAASIGNTNNFDIHIDPTDSVARIIDINYVDAQERKTVYDDLFTLEIHNTKSTVRSYTLESQIFPDQSNIIAIGAQAGGGAMATDNNTMLDFNKGLVDRITPKKQNPLDAINPNPIEEKKNKLANLNTALKSLYEYFDKLDVGIISDPDFNMDKVGDYRNSLKDIINFFKNLTSSDIKNRAIIPIKLSITLDGIGGLVIGHMFKIPEELLPKGYQGDALGSKIGYTITGIAHSVTNDWTTKIEAQTITLDNPSGDALNFGDLIDTSTTLSELGPSNTNPAKAPLYVPAVQVGKGNWTTLNNTIAAINASAARGEWKEARSNPNILAALQATYLPPATKPISMTTTDTTAWCAGFVGYVLKTSGLPYLPNNLWAANYAGYGRDVGFDRANWRQWDIVVYKGHVGFIYGASADGKLITTFGGNQGDNVTTSTFPVASFGPLRGVRRFWTPPSDSLPLNVGKGQANITTR